MRRLWWYAWSGLAAFLAGMLLSCGCTQAKRTEPGTYQPGAKALVEVVNPSGPRSIESEPLPRYQTETVQQTPASVRCTYSESRTLLELGLTTAYVDGTLLVYAYPREPVPVGARRVRPYERVEYDLPGTSYPVLYTLWLTSGTPGGWAMVLSVISRPWPEPTPAWVAECLTGPGALPGSIDVGAECRLLDRDDDGDVDLKDFYLGE